MNLDLNCSRVAKVLAAEMGILNLIQRWVMAHPTPTRSLRTDPPPKSIRSVSSLALGTATGAAGLEAALDNRLTRLTQHAKNTTTAWRHGQTLASSSFATSDFGGMLHAQIVMVTKHAKRRRERS